MCIFGIVFFDRLGELLLLFCSVPCWLLIVTAFSWSSLAAILEQYHDVSDVDGREATGIYEPKVSISHISCLFAPVNIQHI